MSKRANPMAVKAALTYDVPEAATALGKSTATIRNWIKDGLPVMNTRKPHLMSGAAIREYLQNKYIAAKKPLKPTELFCPSCKVGREPAGMLVTITVNTAKTSLLRGACSRCNSTSTRMISAAKTAEFGQVFLIKGSEPRDTY